MLFFSLRSFVVGVKHLFDKPDERVPSLPKFCSEEKSCNEKEHKEFEHY